MTEQTEQPIEPSTTPVDTTTSPVFEFRTLSASPTAEELSAWRATFGVPETAEGYGIHVKPEGWEDDWDEKPQLEMAALLHQHNVPASVAKELAARNTAAALAQRQEDQKFIEGQKALLQAEWGNKIGPNTIAAAEAAKALGVDLDAIGDAATIKAFYKIAGFVQQDSAFRQAMGFNGTQNSIIAENSREKGLDIMRNAANPLHEKYRSGDLATRDLVLKLLAS